MECEVELTEDIECPLCEGKGRFDFEETYHDNKQEGCRTRTLRIIPNPVGVYDCPLCEGCGTYPVTISGIVEIEPSDRY